MLNENLKEIRKQNNMSQEELANRIHVTRQTVSKWERGTSVPDAQLLIQLSDVFQVPVSDLLGTAKQRDEISNTDAIAKKLEAINFSLSERNRRSRHIWRILKRIGVVLLILFVGYLLIGIVSHKQYSEVTTKIETIHENE